MRSILILAISSMLFSCHQKSSVSIAGNSSDSVTYLRETIAFINEVAGKQIQQPKSIINNKPYTFEYDSCLGLFIADAKTLTSNELAFIRQGKYPKVAQWSGAQFPASRFISNDTVRAIFSNRKINGWQYIHEHYGNAINYFSMPIFLRGYTYCIFYASNSCGDLCGEGIFTLYKKENNRWVRIKDYGGWIS